MLPKYQDVARTTEVFPTFVEPVEEHSVTKPVVRVEDSTTEFNLELESNINVNINGGDNKIIEDSNSLKVKEKDNMKCECDEKREVYEFMITQPEGMGNSNSGKGEHITSRPLQAAHNEYEERSTLDFFVPRDEASTEAKQTQFNTSADRGIFRLNYTYSILRHNSH